MNINWTVRVKNKQFWFAMIPAAALLIQQIAALFGVTIDFGIKSKELLAIAETVFAILALLGVVNDPTTKGIADSARALGYDEPHDDTAGLR